MPSRHSQQETVYGVATIRDIAQRAGVAPVTIGRLKRAPERVARDAAARIFATLREVGVDPDQIDQLEQEYSATRDEFEKTQNPKTARARLNLNLPALSIPIAEFHRTYDVSERTIEKLRGREAYRVGADNAEHAFAQLKKAGLNDDEVQIYRSHYYESRRRYFTPRLQADAWKDEVAQTTAAHNSYERQHLTEARTAAKAVITNERTRRKERRRELQSEKPSRRVLHESTPEYLPSFSIKRKKEIAKRISVETGLSLSVTSLVMQGAMRGTGQDKINAVIKAVALDSDVSFLAPVLLNEQIRIQEGRKRDGYSAEILQFSWSQPAQIMYIADVNPMALQLTFAKKPKSVSPLVALRILRAARARGFRVDDLVACEQFWKTQPVLRKRRKPRKAIIPKGFATLEDIAAAVNIETAKRGREPVDVVQLSRAFTSEQYAAESIFNAGLMFAVAARMGYRPHDIAKRKQIVAEWVKRRAERIRINQLRGLLGNEVTTTEARYLLGLGETPINKRRAEAIRDLMIDWKFPDTEPFATIADRLPRSEGTWSDIIYPFSGKAAAEHLDVSRQSVVNWMEGQGPSERRQLLLETFREFGLSERRLEILSEYFNDLDNARPKSKALIAYENNVDESSIARFLYGSTKGISFEDADAIYRALLANGYDPHRLLTRAIKYLESVQVGTRKVKTESRPKSKAQIARSIGLQPQFVYDFTAGYFRSGRTGDVENLMEALADNGYDPDRLARLATDYLYTSLSYYSAEFGDPNPVMGRPKIGTKTQAAIADQLGIHPAQVSALWSGNFSTTLRSDEINEAIFMEFAEADYPADALHQRIVDYMQWSLEKPEPRMGGAKLKHPRQLSLGLEFPTDPKIKPQKATQLSAF